MNRMKNLAKYSSIAFLALSAVVFSSCTDSYSYDKAPAYHGGQAYLVADSLNFTFSPTDAQTFDFKVERNDSTKAETVSLKSDNKVFTIPSEVSFAAGERSKVVPVTFNIPIGETDTLNVSLDSAQAYIYAPSFKRFIVKRDYVWIDLGQGQWTSSIFSQSSAVEVFKAGGADVYRVKEPYEAGHDIDIVVQGSSAMVASQYGFVDSSLGTCNVMSWEKHGIPSTFDGHTFTLKLGIVAGSSLHGPYTETLVLPE